MTDAICFMGLISDHDPLMAYNAVDVLLYPSFYGGFGFPVLEALACGTAVVTSNCASLPEVGGTVAKQADPYSPHAMALAVAEELENADDAVKTAARIAWACEFSWQRTAHATLAAYRKALEPAATTMATA